MVILSRVAWFWTGSLAVSANSDPYWDRMAFATTGKRKAKMMAFETTWMIVNAIPENQMGHTAIQFQFVTGKPKAKVDPMSKNKVIAKPNAPSAADPRAPMTKGHRWRIHANRLPPRATPT